MKIEDIEKISVECVLRPNYYKVPANRPLVVIADGIWVHKKDGTKETDVLLSWLIDCGEWGYDDIMDKDLYKILRTFDNERFKCLWKIGESMYQDQDLWINFYRKEFENRPEHQLTKKFTFMQDAFEDKDFPLAEAVENQFNAVSEYFYNKAKQLMI